MAVAALQAGGLTWDVANRRGEPLPETFHALVEFALLASRQKPFDPMERAVEALARDALAGTEHLHGGWTLVHEYPLGHELLAVTHVWEPSRGGPRVVAAKGAPEAGRGTDVAREASALVLLDDDYSSIVAAIRLGRRIFENIRKAMAYVLSVHVPIAGAALVPALVGWPLVLLPVHIVLLELVIDPACSIAFEAEPEDPDLMRRPPRDPKEPLLPARIVVRALLDGILALIVVLGLVAFSVRRIRRSGGSSAARFPSSASASGLRLCASF
jgi:magnesium-transporting ATPase (P-type)